MTTQHPDTRIGTDLGPYRIEAVIGRGGMGVVYLAQQSSLGRKVALKILPPALADDADFRARFERESKMAAAIDDPNILPIYEAGEIDGVLFIAMRYVEGTDLEARLRRGPVEPRETVRLLAQIASALDAAHLRGLVHRDVKPANILVAAGEDERGDHAYLTDFGLTKLRSQDTSLTRAGTIMGTLDYMAPEQLEGREVEGAADQYALAAIAHRALTGHRPYERDSEAALITAILREPPASAHATRPGLPEAVDAVLARGMAKKPADRFPSCAAFVSELRSALGVTSSAAAAPASSGTMGGRRVPILIGVLLLVGVGAAIGIAGALGGTPAPSASAAPSVARVSPSASVVPSPSEQAYPSAAESALLARLPDGLADDCVRGLYDIVRSDVFRGQAGKIPSASLSCRPAATSGANVVLVRGFEYRAGGGNTAGDFNVDQAVSQIAQTVQAPGGDCATSKRANGRWQLNGLDAGAIVCWVDSSTGDAILVWSYPDARVLVRATNQRGDSVALYDYFTQNARFIAP